MAMKTKYLFLSIAIFAIISCDKPNCQNKNPIFEKFGFETLEYKNELAKQLSLADNEKISYWFDSYIKHDNKEYILVEVQDKNLCAKILILVENWNNIENIGKTKGKSYRGAELVGLNFDIRHDADTVKFVYSSIDHISD